MELFSTFYVAQYKTLPYASILPKPFCCTCFNITPIFFQSLAFRKKPKQRLTYFQYIPRRIKSIKLRWQADIWIIYTDHRQFLTTENHMKITVLTKLYKCVFQVICTRLCRVLLLITHLPLDKMAAVSQTIFSYAFSWMKILYFDSNFTEVCS